MPTSLYLTAHHLAKWARLIRSSICSILLALDKEDGCLQFFWLESGYLCGQVDQSNQNTFLSNFDASEILLTWTKIQISPCNTRLVVPEDKNSTTHKTMCTGFTKYLISVLKQFPNSAKIFWQFQKFWAFTWESKNNLK